MLSFASIFKANVKTLRFLNLSPRLESEVYLDIIALVSGRELRVDVYKFYRIDMRSSRF